MLGLRLGSRGTTKNSLVPVIPSAARNLALLLEFLGDARGLVRETSAIRAALRDRRPESGLERPESGLVWKRRELNVGADL